MFFTTRAFWTDFAERVISTGAAGALTVVTLASFGIFDLTSWHDVAAAAGVSALISALKAFSLQRGATSSTAAADAPTQPPVDTTSTAAVQPTLLERLATAPTGPAVTSAGGVTSTYATGE